MCVEILTLWCSRKDVLNNSDYDSVIKGNGHNNHRIQIFSSDGQFICKLSLNSEPAMVTVTANGNLIVSFNNGNYLERVILWRNLYEDTLTWLLLLSGLIIIMYLFYSFK